MSELPENDSEKPAPATDSQHEEQRTGSTLFRRWPVSIQNPLRRYSERYGAQHKRWCKKRVIRPVRSAWRWFTSDRVFRNASFLFFLIGEALLLWLWVSRRMDSNTVIAIFTVVMAYTTWKGWVAMKDQNKIMTDQNVTIAKQVTLTQGQLAHLEREQRPWLSQSKSQIKPLEIGKRVEGQLPVKNTGKTPAVISGWNLATIIVGPLEKPDQIATRVFETIQPIESVIAPDGGLNLIVGGDTPTITPELMEAFKRPDVGAYGNRQSLYVFVRILYHDLARPDVACVTQCCYIYNPEVNDFYQHSHYNYMT